MRDIVSEIKARLSIEDVVASYVSLKKVGRYYKALSPFQTEKTPSFVVSPEKQIAYCFSTHRGGDMFKFIQEMEGVDFSEAVRILAEKAGIEAPSKGAFKKGQNSTDREALLEAHEKATLFFENNLQSGSADAKKVLEYLNKRGVTDELIKEFRIGYAPDRSMDLLKYLLKEGFKKELLLKSGMLTVKDTAGKDVIDKFRGRLIIPILDHMGRVIGFGGRALGKDQQPKYLNSPDTPLYLKRNVLYGLSHSKQAIREKKEVLFVEGYFDVIMLHKVGIKNVVASSGTALSPEQVGLIKRYATSVVSCFDTDRAGVDATKRAYAVLQPFDMVMKTLHMTEGMKDPADFVVDRGDKAFDEFTALMAGASDFMDFYSGLIVKGFDITSAEGRKGYLDEMVPLLKIVKSSVKLDHFVRIVAKHLDTKEKFIYDEISEFKSYESRVVQKKEPVVINKKVDPLKVLLSICLEFPVHFQKVLDKMKEADFSEELKGVYNLMKDQYNLDRTSKEGWDFDEGKHDEQIDILSLYAEERYGDFPDETVENEVEKLIDNIIKQRRMHQRLELEKALKEAEKTGDEEKKKELLKLFQEMLV
ncbi:DNA primase [Candidatus Peregrinibacteria bacterium]|jgi:DNA primase|nr:DNA primase [Candidatus Peregrinibacteria bacterium]MBT4056112.1 DNA primase [Candidatus Peregrinibacteria bacterium]